MIVSIRDVDLKHAMVDPGSSLHTIHLSILKATWVSRDKITKQPLDFEGNFMLTIGFINLELTIGHKNGEPVPRRWCLQFLPFFARKALDSPTQLYSFLLPSIHYMEGEESA